MTSLKITGGEEFSALAKRLRDAGDRGLQKELYSALNRSTRPLKDAARESALEHLPHTGGLDEIVAAAKMSTRRRGALTVRIEANGIDQLALTNKGKVAHPTFKHRPRVLQSIPKAKDWFYKPLRDGAPEVRRQLVKAMRDIASKIT